ncbi:hypothetical protein [Acrocarpospora pleiomorpha]|uniref:hypothetical protein n=1 Tax=Acrocarpospora pleiomorpha TaxID=90975 RepID=UPI0012D2ED90|nr:hypothetical protein [Acrocarpospora pleiomorpha]
MDPHWLPEPAVGHPVLREDALAEIVANPTPAMLPKIAITAALIVAEATGLPDVRPLLADRQEEARAQFEALAAEMLQLAGMGQVEGVASLESNATALHNRGRAALAVVAALADDPLQGARLAVVRAKQVRGLDPDTRLRLQVLGECTRFISSRG